MLDCIRKPLKYNKYTFLKSYSKEAMPTTAVSNLCFLSFLLVGHSVHIKIAKHPVSEAFPRRILHLIYDACAISS